MDSNNYMNLESYGNESIHKFGKILFETNIDKLDECPCKLLLDQTMNIEDHFCMLVELVLCGLNILLSDVSSLFSLDSVDSEIIFMLKRYFNHIGYKFIIRHSELVDAEKCQFELVNHNPLIVVEYDIPTTYTKLSDYKIFFNTTDNIFIVSFDEE